VFLLVETLVLRLLKHFLIKNLTLVELAEEDMNDLIITNPDAQSKITHKTEQECHQSWRLTKGTIHQAITSLSEQLAPLLNHFH
jgi:hypothetical protein